MNIYFCGSIRGGRYLPKNSEEVTAVRLGFESG
uniref:Uncharacterized protein n=1 Tax=Sinocyclocheilus grahami TaxID=75366 RepID=A0A672L2F5_SINGR